jgi:DNA-binding MarR family transcriptional regulator
VKSTVYQDLLRRYEIAGVPPLPEGMNDSLREFFEYLLEEEAQFLLALSEMPAPVGRIAKKVGMTEGETRRMLERLIEKTMVVDHQVEGVEERRYSLATRCCSWSSRCSMPGGHG